MRGRIVEASASAAVAASAQTRSTPKSGRTQAVSNQGKFSRARPRKTAVKTAVSPLNGARIPLGAHPGNTGGKPGRSGRPPKAFKDFLAELRRNSDAQGALARAAKDEKLRTFGAAWGVATDYDDEKPAKKVELVEALSTTERALRIERILQAVRAGKR